MICNNCNYRETCKYVYKDLYFSWENECYIQHVNECLKEWNNIHLEYLGSLSRILGIRREEVDMVIRMSMLLHDVGKLTKLYQRKIREKVQLEGFKHEVLGSAYTFKLLNELKLNDEIPYVAGWAVLLHHEALRRNLKPEQLIIPMNNPEAMVNGRALLLLEDLLKDNLNIGNVNISDMSRDYVGRIVDWLFKYNFQSSSKHILRLKVASLQHIICFSDVRAANRIRGGEVSSPYFREVIGVY
ncbi:MAG: CRISPR-associated endonuclease Cas3'' [Candidatus Methanomethylicia archaeon]